MESAGAIGLPKFQDFYSGEANETLVFAKLLLKLMSISRCSFFETAQVDQSFQNLT